MKLLGKRSVASFLRGVLSFVWWAGIGMFVLFIAFTVVFCFLGSVKGLQPPPFELDADFVKIEFTHAVMKDPRALLLSFLPFAAAMFALGLAIIHQLRKIFTTLSAGNPFVLENANRMRRISMFIFGGAVLEFLAGNIIGRIIMESVSIPGVHLSVKGNLDLCAVFFGFVMLILAEIFRQGSLLKEEQELTI